MKRIHAHLEPLGQCAWCGVILSTGPRQGKRFPLAVGQTHGICASCAARGGGYPGARGAVGYANPGA